MVKLAQVVTSLCNIYIPACYVAAPSATPHSGKWWKLGGMRMCSQSLSVLDDERSQITGNCGVVFHVRLAA